MPGWAASEASVERLRAAPRMAATGPSVPSLGAASVPSQKRTSRVEGLSKETEPGAGEGELAAADPAGEGARVGGDGQVLGLVGGPRLVDGRGEVVLAEQAAVEAVSRGDDALVVDDQRVEALGALDVGEDLGAGAVLERAGGLVLRAGELDRQRDAEHVHHGGVAVHATGVVGELGAVVQDVVVGVAGDPARRIGERGLAVAVLDRLELELAAERGVDPAGHPGQLEGRGAARGERYGVVGEAVRAVVGQGDGLEFPLGGDTYLLGAVVADDVDPDRGVGVRARSC